MRKAIMGIALAIGFLLSGVGAASAWTTVCVKTSYGYNNYVYLSRVTNACVNGGRCINSPTINFTERRGGYRCGMVRLNAQHNWCLSRKNRNDRNYARRVGNVLYFE